ncbi:sugar phosphate isomerase/epimerase family protein [Stratiformator vulcanicus]|uniref:Inosose isomerase n=1 Tax=Stratiformator vulcanicus TaxID=2527980 RepID=A0A517R3A1_9PLAN|nr:sugar phosphate isomerase/epimerase family protein [Stratiformator vulcanicus]QDT38343.1 Inosose isomerase [Stratiformator vulcanicus]
MKTNRRDFLTTATAIGLGSGLSLNAADPPPRTNIRYCLNTSTIRGQKLGIEKEVQVAAAAGYNGIEPWIRDIEVYRDAGGSLTDLKQKIADAGLKVESAIGFANWIVDDPKARAAGLEQAKREMDLLKQIGGTRIAAPPAGAHRSPIQADLDGTAERFAALCQAGESIDITPQLEVWGFSQTLSKLSEVLYVAAACGHSNSLVLPDVYHLYKGGSPFEGLRFLSPETCRVFHLNDYPDIPRDKINDGDRVFPTDGIAPFNEVLKHSGILKIENPPTLSLEVFNKSYWRRDPLEVAREGLRKMKQTIASS